MTEAVIQKNRNPAELQIISVESLVKGYKRSKGFAINHVSFKVNKGQIFGLIGADGAGKTSVIQILVGVLSANAGKVIVNDIDVLREPESVKKIIGYMPQGLGLNLYNSLTIEENIDFFRDLHQLPEKQFEENRRRLLAITKLTPFLKRPAGKLSGGMRQKLSLICSLIHLPDILLLDEPTTGVDPISRREFWAIIQDLVKNRHITVLLTTAYMDEAERCHTIALMHEGKIVASGSPNELVSLQTPRLEDVFIHNLMQEQKIEKLNGSFTNHSSVTQNKDSFDDIDNLKQTEHLVIRTENLTCRFGDFTAVDQVNIKLEKGKILGLLGPNGAGKTTLIKMLCGLQSPSSGMAFIAEHDVSKYDHESRLHIGYMSQRFSLYRDLSVVANMRLYGNLYNLSNERLNKRIETLISELGLQGYQDRFVAAIPRGICQRLALGCAIIHEPKILFLDEPTSGVDPIARIQFWNIIHSLSQKHGVTVLVTTHYMDEAAHYDLLAFMQHGKIIALGAPQELKEQAEKLAGPLIAVEAVDFNAAYDLLKPVFPYAIFYGRLIKWQSLQPQTDIHKTMQLFKQHKLQATVKQEKLSTEETFISFLKTER